MLIMLIHWLLSAAILLFIANFLPGIDVNGLGTALFAIFIMAVINLLIRPILSLITLPINILTMGLFSFIVNALMFALAAWLVPGFEVSNFFSALIGSLLLAFLTGLMENLYASHQKAV